MFGRIRALDLRFGPALPHLRKSARSRPPTSTPASLTSCSSPQIDRDWTLGTHIVTKRIIPAQLWAKLGPAACRGETHLPVALQGLLGRENPSFLVLRQDHHIRTSREHVVGMPVCRVDVAQLSRRWAGPPRPQTYQVLARERRESVPTNGRARDASQGGVPLSWSPQRWPIFASGPGQPDMANSAPALDFGPASPHLRRAPYRADLADSPCPREGDRTKWAIEVGRGASRLDRPDSTAQT